MKEELIALKTDTRSVTQKHDLSYVLITPARNEVEFIELFTCQLRNAKKSAIVLFAFDTLKRGEYIDPSNLRSRKKVELQLTRNGWEVTNFKV